MKRTLLFAVGFAGLLIIFLSSIAFGISGKVPYPLQAAICQKILNFNNSLNKGGEIWIHVIDSHPFAVELKKLKGKPIGKSILAKVTEGKELPEKKPHAIYFTDAAQFESVTKYSRTNKVLTITDNKDLVDRGVSICVGLSGNKPKIFLNIKASAMEGMAWNPVVFKIVEIIK